MYFIDRDRRIKLIGFFTLLALHHFFRQTTDKRRGFRAHLRFEGVRVRFDSQLTVGIDHLIFIQLTMLRTGDKQLPDTAFFAQAHRVATAIPVVELTNHRNTLGVGCPDGETRTGDAIHGIRMRTQRFVRSQMRTFR